MLQFAAVLQRRCCKLLSVCRLQGSRPAVDARVAAIQQALAELSPACQACFVLYRLENLTCEQIAERLGMAPDQVHASIVMALKHCRGRMPGR